MFFLCLAVARVQRHISDTGQTFIPEQGVLQVTTAQDQIPVSVLPSQSSRFVPVNIKSPAFTHPGSITTRPATTLQPSAHLTQPPPPTSAPQFDFSSNQSLKIPASKLTLADPYASQPATPKPQFTTPRPTPQTVSRPDGPDINRQLRDLLQKQQQQQQQFKKLDELQAGKGQQRIWPPQISSTQEVVPTETSEFTQANSVVDGATFRHPLPPPPGIRPRGPVAPNIVTNIVRHPSGNIVGLRMPVGDSRIQGLDPRMRLIIQHQVSS